jgi:hypothetical protein
MARRTVQIDNQLILISDDEPRADIDRMQAVMKIHVTDELTGTTPQSPVTLAVAERGIAPRLSADGFGGLIGIPHELFPNLNGQDYPVHLTVSAPRYQRVQIKQDVPQDNSFPTSFTPIDREVALHRQPVYIAGRTARWFNNASAPVAAAQISVTGIWRTAPAANVVVAADPPNIVALQPPLYLDRAALAQSLARRDLTPVAGNDKTLLDEVPAGATNLRLSNRLGLAIGDILFIDSEHADLMEFIAIKNLPTTAPADAAVSLTLEHAAIFAHRRGGLVRQINPQAAGASQNLSVDALAGDTCVFLSGLAGLSGAAEVEIGGAPGANEYHKLMQFTVASDADGYYRLPPLSRVAQLELRAEKIIGAQTFQATKIFRPDYRQRDNRLDFLLAA